jgi:multidrug efflux pump subunit AcrA (membrane-fusion protein)
MDLGKYNNKYYIGAALAAVLLIVLWLVLRAPAVSVETAVVKTGPFVVTIDAEGRTRFRDKFTVTAPVSGIMSRVKLKEGDNIPRDFEITGVDPNPPMPRPPSETEGRPNAYAAKVYAPASGKVLRVYEKSERYVQAGTPIIEIGDTSKVEIVIDVLSSDAAEIRPMATVLIESPNSSEPIRALVRTVEPQAVTKISPLGVEERRVDVVADLVDKSTGFGDNFRVDAQIIVWQADNVMQIPNSALFRVGDEWVVYVIESGKARSRRVTAGRRSNAMTQITEGLTDGEVVIAHPSPAVADGTRVRYD